MRRAEFFKKLRLPKHNQVSAHDSVYLEIAEMELHEAWAKIHHAAKRLSLMDTPVLVEFCIKFTKRRKRKSK